jgi:hypothetical protein
MPDLQGIDMTRIAHGFTFAVAVASDLERSCVTALEFASVHSMLHQGGA